MSGMASGGRSTLPSKLSRVRSSLRQMSLSSLIHSFYDIAGNRSTTNRDCENREGRASVHLAFQGLARQCDHHLALGWQTISGCTPVLAVVLAVVTKRLCCVFLPNLMLPACLTSKRLDRKHPRMLNHTARHCECIDRMGECN